MLSADQIATVQATIPALRAHGETITKTFYDTMLQAHPELFNYFNPANQRAGGQASSLAASVLTYAENIDKLSRLGGMVDRIAAKHVSLEILPEHYPIVGTYLLGAITSVLGDAATPAILDAWQAAYGQLADIMIGHEATLYSNVKEQPGGWAGFKPFRVAQRTAESDVMTSFSLVPADGSVLPPFKAGQYIAVKVRPPELAYDQIRQYSLSAAPDGRRYRISVKREDAPSGQISTPPGLVSNYLDKTLQVGDTILVHAPGGDFTLDETSSAPLVLMSGGAGITAVLAMLEHLADNTTRDVVFLHAVRARGHHAFAEQVRALAAKRPGIRAVTFYDEAGPDDVAGTHYDVIGRITAHAIGGLHGSREAEFYYCGPIGFMTAADKALDELAIPLNRRHSEAFAPDLSFATLTN